MFFYRNVITHEVNLSECKVRFGCITRSSGGLPKVARRLPKGSRKWPKRNFFGACGPRVSQKTRKSNSTFIQSRSLTWFNMIYLKHSACHTFNTLLRSPKEPNGIHEIQANPRDGTFTAPATLFEWFFPEMWSPMESIFRDLMCILSTFWEPSEALKVWQARCFRDISLKKTRKKNISQWGSKCLRRRCRAPPIFHSLLSNSPPLVSKALVAKTSIAVPALPVIYEIYTKSTQGHQIP